MTTQSVENCIPTQERAERSPRLSCDAPRRMPFWTLRVLFECIAKNWSHFHYFHVLGRKVPFAALMIQG
ncbi:hypothetical protein CCL14_19905 [Pseudomonas syringae]|nr:hypothetical protein CCL14_19905 [Pseudomonas syringae]